MHRKGYITVEKLVEKVAHNPAILFEIKDRGYIREGYKADLVLINPNAPWTVTKENIDKSMGYSSPKGSAFKRRPTTFIGNIFFGKIAKITNAERLTFNR